MRRCDSLLVIGLAAAAVAGAAAARADDPLFIERPDAFTTLVNPQCSHCVDEAKRRAADLRDDDRVLAWTRGKYDGGGIPIRFFLSPFRVISDTYGVFVYDPDAGFARGFEPSLDFKFHGWRNGVMVMRHQDGTLFSTLSGRAFAGPRSGERLKPIATLTTTWGFWNGAYPGTVAYHMFEKYQPVELPKTLEPDSLRSRGPVDPRLSADAEVLGVEYQGAAKAYPLRAIPGAAGLIEDELGGAKIVVLWYAPTRTAAAYLSSVDGEAAEVSLKVDGSEPAAPFVDRASGSRWDIAGRAVSGPLKGKTLGWLDGVQCRWFAWAADYPETLVFEAKRVSAAEKKTR